MDHQDTYDELWMFSTDDEEEEVCIPVLKRGRKSLIKKHPQLATVVGTFIKEHSAEAHNRRRTATAYTNGVSLADIKRHAIASVPGLQTISRTTIHRMMKPARKGSLNAKRHSGVVDARVPPKKNSAAQSHDDFRYTCAAVNYLNELAALCEDECVLYSCDDKNKINVGTMAVSRHFQIRRFFTSDDQPDYPDHDFPYPNSKLIPSGYMRLAHKKRTRSLDRVPSTPTPIRRSRSSSPHRRSGNRLSVRDKTGRTRISWPRSGPLDVFLQAARFHQSNSSTHAKHLYQLLHPLVHDPVNPKRVATIIADGGPDWSTKSLVNLINYGRLWKDLELDGLVIVTYAPRHSRFNPIERAWAPLSKWLTGVTLPRTLEGEDLPPSQQNDLTEEEVLLKEADVFDKAVIECSKYWCNKKFDDFPVTVHRVPSLPSRPASRYNDHEEVKGFCDASAAQILTNDSFGAIRNDLIFLLEHCTRRPYQMEFFKCDKGSCHHCCVRPIQARKFIGIIDRFGRKVPCPVPDPARQRGEYMSLMELLDSPGTRQTAEEVLPSGVRERCSRGCRYVFASAADKRRHNTLVHSKKLL